MESFDPNTLRKAMELSATPAGQQLIQLLQKSGGPQLRQAMDSWQAGDPEQARQALSGILNQPELKKLLEQLGR